MYKKPKQARAIATEERFLSSFEQLLNDHSFHKVSVDDIARHAGLERGAFLQRFGSKKQALLLLWQRYCDKCATEIDTFIANLPDNSASLEETCTQISKTLEQLQLQHFAANRAINEHFMEDLNIAEPTKLAFLHSVQLMRCVQKKFLETTGNSEAGAFAAAQISLTVNYNYVIKAMPALPKDAQLRHRLIGTFIASALRM